MKTKRFVVILAVVSLLINIILVGTLIWRTIEAREEIRLRFYDAAVLSRSALTAYLQHTDAPEINQYYMQANQQFHTMYYFGRLMGLRDYDVFSVFAGYMETNPEKVYQYLSLVQSCLIGLREGLPSIEENINQLRQIVDGIEI